MQATRDAGCPKTAWREGRASQSRERTSAGPRLRSSTFRELDGAIIPPVSDTISSACRSTNEKPPRLRHVEAVSCPSQTRECAPASKRPGPNLKVDWKPP
ncbi:hypothetical protein JTB14_011056 [Gonioctena quinquepunctata]|nr:hypothetical protein JTB14_019057 [Gonioctena quinquepunctata]KAG5896061.1 hypothetical protein JTB14_011056 [Gonioctena quinquepunctata]